MDLLIEKIYKAIEPGKLRANRIHVRQTKRVVKWLVGYFTVRYNTVII